MILSDPEPCLDTDAANLMPVDGDLECEVQVKKLWTCMWCLASDDAECVKCAFDVASCRNCVPYLAVETVCRHFTKPAFVSGSNLLGDHLHVRPARWKYIAAHLSLSLNVKVILSMQRLIKTKPKAVN